MKSAERSSRSRSVTETAENAETTAENAETSYCSQIQIVRKRTNALEELLWQAVVVQRTSLLQDKKWKIVIVFSTGWQSCDKCRPHKSTYQKSASKHQLGKVTRPTFRNQLQVPSRQTCKRNPIPAGNLRGDQTRARGAICK